MWSLLRNTRVAIGVSAIVLVVLAGAGYLGMVSLRGSAEPPATAALTGNLLFVDLTDGQFRVRQLDVGQGEGRRSGTGMKCQRVATAGGTTVCLRLSGVGPRHVAEVLDANGQVLRTIPLPGVPSRAKVSASGKIITWTSFVSGDSYAVPGGFSTRTGYLDLRTGESAESIEHFTAFVDGKRVTAPDVNYWGMTVSADDRTFHATLASGDKTWLIRGDLTTKTVRSIGRQGECPSLSPDGTMLAYKKRISRLGPWDLAVLDLETGAERRLPGTAGIDDQATWLGNERLAFAGLPRDARRPVVMVVPSDGSEPAEVLVADATSPSPVG